LKAFWSILPHLNSENVAQSTHAQPPQTPVLPNYDNDPTCSSSIHRTSVASNDVNNSTNHDRLHYADYDTPPNQRNEYETPKYHDEVAQLRAQVRRLEAQVGTLEAQADKLEAQKLKHAQELEDVRRWCIDNMPIGQIGFAIRDRFLEQTKETLGYGAAYQKVIKAGNAAAHHVNIQADLTMYLIKFHAGINAHSAGLDVIEEEITGFYLFSDRKEVFSIPLVTKYFLLVMMMRLFLCSKGFQ
jgi:hypothetical protein